MSISPDPRQLACTRAGALLDSLDLHLRRALKTSDAEQIHALRVATRRFTQALVIFESFVRGSHGIREDLKLPMTLSGEVRDFDIALKILGDSDAAAPKIIDSIERDRAKSERMLVKALAKMSERGTLGKWRLKLASHQSETAKSAGADTKKAVLRAARRFFDRGDKAFSVKDHNPKDSTDHLHDFRIATKELRYTLELGSSPAGALRRKHEQVEELQSDLGDIHDFESVREIVSKYRGAKKLLGPLAKKQRKRIRKLRAYWKQEFGGKKNHAGWMRRITGVANSILSSEEPARRPPARARSSQVGRVSAG
jgi:CHAD domain-containing protein